jgi:hypothetical protein
VPEIVDDYWVANEPKMQKTIEARRGFFSLAAKLPNLA